MKIKVCIATACSCSFGWLCCKSTEIFLSPDPPMPALTLPCTGPLRPFPGHSGLQCSPDSRGHSLGRCAHVDTARGKGTFPARSPPDVRNWMQAAEGLKNYAILHPVFICRWCPGLVWRCNAPLDFQHQAQQLLILTPGKRVPCT